MSQIRIKHVSVQGDGWEELQALELAVFGSPKSAKLLSSFNNLEFERYALIAYLDDAPVGFATGYLDGEIAWVLNVGVLSFYRRRGVGSALLAAIEQLCAAKNARELRLLVERRNRDAQQFYRALGYEELCETFESQYDSDEFMMMVKLIKSQ